METYNKWYAGEKYNAEIIIKKYSDQIYNDDVETEWNKHKEWQKIAKLEATPTILLNGFKIPQEYEIEDLLLLQDALLLERIQK